MKETKRRPRLRWLDNIDRHHKGKNTSLKEVLRKECFKNRQNWRTLISRSTDRNSGEDPSSATWSVVSSEHHSPLLQIIIQCTMQEYILLRTYMWLCSRCIGTNGNQLVPGQWACNRVFSTKKINSCLLHA